MDKPPQVNRSLLACARKKRGWTQEYVAEQISVSVDTVRQWERGRHYPYQASIHQLCTLFQVTPEELGLLKQQDYSLSLVRGEILAYGNKITAHDNTEFHKHITQHTRQQAGSVLALPGETIQGMWEPEEKKAAWEVYIELVTRVPIAALESDERILHETLSSLDSLFHTTKAILRSYGPAIAHTHKDNTLSFSYLAVCMLNITLRPLLSRWSPLLEVYEETRPAFMNVIEHEQKWEKYSELRQEIMVEREVLIAYAQAFAQIAESSSLIIEMPEV